MTHVPVLLENAVDALNVRSNGIYVDATLGRGGHSRAILDRLGTEGRLIALDQDAAAIEYGRAMFADDARTEIIQQNFAELDQLLDRLELSACLDGLLIDLGVSSPQLDDAERGFSFTSDGPLDMRMNPEAGTSAVEWLAEVDQQSLARVLRDYGEERFAGRIARAIIEARARTPITRTAQLAGIIERAMPAASKNASRVHPATRSFQAIRIHINRELDVLDQVLESGIKALAPGGRFVVISFHSLEDRRVKSAFQKASVPPPADRRRPLTQPFVPSLKKIGKLIRPDEAECAANPRARSARMRVAERVSGATP
ncbi:MAG: 16S rRNA (cytosine(1402)-N(4))-methyltransferase RsmH [Pseudomonadota bacterium]